MRRAWVLVAVLVLSLAASCNSGGTATTILPTQTPQPTDTPAKTTTPACPPARGTGTVPPAISIDSIIFVVNGSEQIVRDGDTLQASLGDQVRVGEISICVGPFSGDGGEVCVDLAPVHLDDQEPVSEHRGTHAMRVTPGIMSFSGPGDAWTVGEDWRQIAIVVNHWLPDGTGDLDCGDGRCEQDDRIVVELRK